MASAPQRVLFSGGGTVGHLSPGFALAAALDARGVAGLFATPGEQVERSWFHGREAPRRIHARRLPRSAGTALTFPVHLARGVYAARRLIRREGVDAVIALGGWPCVPAVLAARLTKTPLVFLVPDAVPGLVVRKFRRWAGRIYLAGDAARTDLEPHLGLRVTGPLLRELGAGGTDAHAVFGLDPSRATLLVTGGSLGARGLNERFLAGLEEAAARGVVSAESAQILHSAGGDAGAAQARYESLGLPHHVCDYIQDMGSAYRAADLVLARAGANTCAELEATATPAVFVPYPHHADRQQFRNAEPLVARGGARVIEEEGLTPAAVSDVLALLGDAPALDAMRASLTGGAPDAAAVAADDLIRFLKGEPSPNAAKDEAAKEGA